MTKRLASKYKLNRRLGLNLWGRPKSPVNRREYGPGQHGARRSKLSGYGLQLSAKQRLRGYYGNIVEKQFRRYYREAVRLRGDSSQHLVGLLESRLDAIVYRAKFASTVFAARQLVSHGHVQVNGKRTNVASTLVKVGSEVALSPKASELAIVLEATAMQERDIPDYIDVDHKKMRATYLKTPTLEDIPYPVKMEPNLVVEYYSR